MKKLIAMILALALVLALAACGAPAKEEVDYSVITTNSATQSVTIYTQVNGKYFTEPSRHGVVFKDGSNGEKCILRGLCSEKDFYGALISIGGVPGDNLGLPSPDGAIIDGQKMNVTVSWEGSNGEIPWADIMTTGNGKPYVADFRFGGNITKAYAKNTGCILCIESCPVGICSNAAYGYGVVESTKTEQFYGNPDVLPEDGTICQVTFTLLAE
ncbi:MAG: hypothetical protein IKY96_03500 [Oscillospiraceae bacterium]|nr:hypothetical protein [Oscillospiraceae bacterium]